MRRIVPIILLVLAACRIERAPSGRPPGPPTAADSLAQVEQDSALAAGVEAAVRLHYQRYAARDWRAFRRGFWPGATIATRIAPAGARAVPSAAMSVDEFVRRESASRLPVLGEQPVHVHVTGYGDVADAWVVAERHVGGHDGAAMGRGIDAFHLVNDGAEWRITSLLATPEEPGRRLAAPQRRPARRAVRASATARKSAP